MNGVQDLTLLIDYLFTVFNQIWTQLIMTNIFLFITAILSLVALVIRIKNATTK